MQTRVRLLGFAVVVVALLANHARGQRVTVGPGPELTAQERDVADRARTKVVLLRTQRRSGTSSATGILAAPRLVLTAGHALSGVSSVRVWLNGVSYRADVLAQHPELDLGLLKLRGSVERGDSGSPILRVKDGKVIGILSSRELPDESGLSFVAYAVPSDLIYPWLRTDPIRAAVAQKPADSDFYLFQR